MTRTVVLDPSDPTPIWRQIEEGVRRLVASGALEPGRVAPSVRDLAKELRVNPATVAKAYQRLTDAGVLTVRRGEGTFVAAAPPRLSETERRRVLREGATRFATLATSIGASRENAAAALDEVWSDFEVSGGKGAQR